VRTLVRVFVIDVVPELARAGRISGSGAQSLDQSLLLRTVALFGSPITGVREGFLEEIREAVSDRG
jgi:hypothetical protein